MNTASAITRCMLNSLAQQHVSRLTFPVLQGLWSLGRSVAAHWIRSLLSAQPSTFDPDSRKCGRGRVVVSPTHMVFLDAVTWPSSTH